MTVVSPMLPARQYPPAGRRILRRLAGDGPAPPVEALYGYESMRVVLAALRAAGNRATDRAELIEAARDEGARGSVLGRYRFDRARRHLAAADRAVRPRGRGAAVPRPGARLGRPLAVAPQERERHPARGYALAAAAAAMWALNGSMARYLLDDGVGAVRALGAALARVVADPAAWLSASRGRTCCG